MSRRQLLGDTLIYGSTFVLRSIVGITLTPIYTRALVQAEFAALDLVISAGALVALLLDLQIGIAANRYYRSYLKNGEQKEFLGTVFVFRVVTASIPILFLGGLGHFYEIGYFPPVPAGRAMWLGVVLGIPLTLISETLFFYLRMEERKRPFVILSISSAIVGASFSILCVLVFKMGAFGVIVGQILSSLVICFLLVWTISRDIIITFRRPMISKLIRFGFPAVPGLLLGWCWVYMSRFYLAELLPLQEIAVFSLAMKVLLLIGFLGGAFRLAWEPLAMKMTSIVPKAGDEWHASTFSIYASILLLATTILSGLSRPIIALLGPDAYSGAAELVPYLAISSALGFIAIFLNIGNQVANKNWWGSIATLLGFVTMGIFVLLLTPSLGLVGTSFGMLMGSIVQVIVAFLSSQANHRIAYDGRGMFVAGVGFLLVTFLHTLSFVHTVPRIVCEISTLTVGSFMSWRILTRVERSNLVHSSMSFLKERGYGRA